MIVTIEHLVGIACRYRRKSAVANLRHSYMRIKKVGGLFVVVDMFTNSAGGTPDTLTLDTAQLNAIDRAVSNLRYYGLYYAC